MSQVSAEAIRQHAALTEELADDLREYATMEATVLRQRGHLFDAYNDGRSISAIRDAVSAHTAPFEADMIELRGRIDATRAMLRHVELIIEHHIEGT